MDHTISSVWKSVKKRTGDLNTLSDFGKKVFGNLNYEIQELLLATNDVKTSLVTLSSEETRVLIRKNNPQSAYGEDLNPPDQDLETREKLTKARKLKYSFRNFGSNCLNEKEAKSNQVKWKDNEEEIKTKTSSKISRRITLPFYDRKIEM
jgi:hypothetical protein